MSSEIAQLAAGLLIAADELEDDESEEVVADRLTRLLERGSCWVPGIKAEAGDDRPVMSPMRRARERVQRWIPPEADVPAARAAVLEAAWHTSRDRLHQQYLDTWGPPIIRLAVEGFAERQMLLDCRPGDGTIISPIVPRRSGDFGWQWPLRISIVDGPRSDDWKNEILTLDESYQHLVHVEIVEPIDVRPGDIVVAPAGPLALVPAASTLIVVGDGLADFRDLVRVVTDRDDGVVVLAREPNVEWIADMVIELSHDFPLDAALAKASDDVAVLADPTLIGMSSVRAHAQWVTDRLTALALVDPTVMVETQFGRRWRGPDTPIEHLEIAESVDLLTRMARDGRFDSEQGTGSDIASVRVIPADFAPHDPVFELADSNLDHVHVVSAPRAAATAGPRAPTTSPVEPVPRTRGGTIGPATGETERVEIAQADRHVQLRLRRPDESVVIDEITGRGEVTSDEVLRLSIAIAAARRAGAVRTDRAFQPLDDDVDLEVAIHIEGVTPNLWVVPLPLPKSADSDFTEEIEFHCPAMDLTVMVAVMRHGRPLQTATFWMPVDQPDAEPSFTVDRSGPLPATWRDENRARAAALASFPGQDGPMLIALTGDSTGTASDHFAGAYQQVKDLLKEGFTQARTTLEQQWPTLAEVARLGRTLYTAIDGEAFDDSEWIHVVDFATAELPLELVYTRPIGTADDVTGMCAEGAAGAVECAATCPSRANRDVVCPNAFWASSKVLERRSHVAGRVRRHAAARREISVRAPAAIGMSSKLAAVDLDAERKVVAAVTGLAAGSSVAEDWPKLEGLVESLDPNLIVLIPHTEHDADAPKPDDVLLEIGHDLRPIDQLDARVVNVGDDEPGPIVLAIGCETEDAAGGFATLTENLHQAGAEAVITAIASVPGEHVAQFMASFCETLVARLQVPEGGAASLADVMRATRRTTLAHGNLIGIAVAMSGDGEVTLVP